MRTKYSNGTSTVLIILLSSFLITQGCKNIDKKLDDTNIMKEKQITFEPKTHDLDNNHNFSPDGKFLCYDTRGMVFNNNLANSKSIEKVEIATGEITVLWEPKSLTGENAAPGVAAVSYHPIKNEVIFIHGPLLDEVEERGYYNIRNRTGVIVSADGKKNITKVDKRDIAINRATIPGAQRGGTHSHEFSRDGKRIGFTYDDFLQQDYDRTIGYMEANENSPEGYTHYFAVLIKPSKKGTSKAGEIERAFSDSWVDYRGTKRAFIGKVRAENGVDYENSLFVAVIPGEVDITTAISGDKDNYPSPPKGIKIRRLTHNVNDDGIVRGSYDGQTITYLSEDQHGIKQVFVIAVDGSDLSDDPKKKPKQVTNFKSDASNIRWHPSDKWIFSISDDMIYASNVEKSNNFGKTILLTSDNLNRGNLVVSPNGLMLAYNVKVKDKKSQLIIEGKIKDEFDQIFVLKLDHRFKMDLK
ncbi:MAG: DUF3748 domain-containing protein [Flavobacteriaceae bacterium]|nr:DUF3748 domain-containing protein [Flavobacteriaceae bacterium]